MDFHQVAKVVGLDLMMVSAKTGENVDEAFNDLARKVLRKQPKKPKVVLISHEFIQKSHIFV